MPCFFPLQVFRPVGSKKICFDVDAFHSFRVGESVFPSVQVDRFAIPCGRCIGCRLERSRQWAVRIVHEASLYDDNCFITLTFDNKHLLEMCPSLSLDRSHMQKFFKRLRQEFSERKIRVFYCGEYGGKFGRPHYHACLFNVDFEDKRYWKSCNGHRYYISDLLRKIWPYGNNIVGDLTFQSGAYVARYCTKVVTGKDAESYYAGRLPEFAQPSLKPGLGTGWLDKYGETDCFALDELVIRGAKCKPPRYYDKYLEKKDPLRFEHLKQSRLERAEAKQEDNTFERLLVKEKCQVAKFRKLVRSLEDDC